jgi:hypothetical protein
MNVEKFVTDNADKIEKIIFDSQGNVKEIKMKDPGPCYYPVYPEPPEPYIVYEKPWWDQPTVTWGDTSGNPHIDQYTTISGDTYES